MKTKYFFMSMLSVMALTASFTACSSDDDDPTPEVVESKAITVDTDTLKMDVAVTSTFNITDGGGDYKVFSENPEVATASVENNTVSVTSLRKGKTGVVISDAQGNYKRVVVQSMYMTMSLDKEAVAIGIKLGHTDGRATVKVTAGNGGYTAVVADENVATAQVSGDNIVLTAKAEGSTTLTVTDMMGLTKTVPVTVESSSIPYTDEEKQEIVNTLTDNKMVWDGQQANSWGNYAVVKDGDNNVVTWAYYTYYYLKFNIGADLTVGTKTNCTVEAKMDWGSDGTTYDNVTVEILKNDGSRIWGIVYVIKDNYLHYGYFCMGL
ncbi:MAG: pilus assembly protein N-terminal domain-containing protein [Prevotella sp.]|nr:pilus assembly protein N-terminal domain-containing protein [Prevotella sp.]